MKGAAVTACVVSLCFALTLLCWPASAQDFYKGRTLTIMVGFPPGGGFDSYARVLSRHIADHIPGHPDIIVQNMPGAASMAAVRYLDNNAPSDGTVVTMFNFGQIGDSRMRPDTVKADFRNFNWLGSLGEDPVFCFVSERLGLQTLSEIKAHGKFFMGLTAAGGSTDIDQKILQKLFGLQIVQVSGYPGSAEERIALQRGELDGDCTAWSAIPPDGISAMKIVPFVNFASFRPKEMDEGVPFAVDLAATSQDRDIIKFLTASNAIGRPLIASSRVAQDRMQILRDAFSQTVSDPAFLTDAAALRLTILPKVGEAAARIVQEVYQTPDDVVDIARKIMAE